MKEEIKTFIQILIEGLEKKEQLLNEIIKISSNQNKILSDSSFDMNAFESSMEEKEKIIVEVSNLDLGFDRVYDRVRDELNNNKNSYQNQIIIMQTLITRLTELSVKLQTMEEQNKVKLEKSLLNQRQKIKSSKMSSQTAASYYKNMSSQHQGESYFLDKKK